ncbi:Mor transcription activator family protein [Rhodoferax sp.]|uniref:Mor transcription activator family protein n=1 Tax=Rhodoferax sp. TaxID=50421 RepID=UPI002604154A|nr:Mor transcription activator family protein [Rhodoferax sp.]MDD5478746.1 Mor transcription activator family protein [Rhodoferax sp.]
MTYTLALVNAFGGTLFVPPRSRDKGGEETFSAIESVIGFDAAIELGRLFKSEEFSVPKCQKAQKVMRDIELVRDFDLLTKHTSARKTVNLLAEKYGLSWRQVEIIVQRQTMKEANPQAIPAVQHADTVSARNAHDALTQLAGAGMCR